MKTDFYVTLVALLALSGCSGASDQASQPAGYCYRTLADVVCYTAPDPGREGRLTGEIASVEASAAD